MIKDLKFAILIDADNIADKYTKIILDEVANYGVATYKRIYGNWTNLNMSSWKNVLLENSITPVQQYNYTTGKNSTDSAMIIDAMDILYSKSVDGFCIISSDSDFTRLASRLRESGMMVIGMGEKKTPRPFISACNQFKYLDVLLNDFQSVTADFIKPNSSVIETKPEVVKNQESSRVITPSSELYQDIKNIKKTILNLVEEGSDEDGWMFTGDLGNQLLKRYSDFDARNFGFKKFTPFLESLDLFEFRYASPSPESNVKLVYIKIKKKKK